MTASIIDFSTEQLVAARRQSQTHQRRAADPACSAWVSANAGTGKTYVLVMRVLRLLLSGASADSILCLTFTKAAAAEMSNRLTARLGEWAAMSDAALTEALATILERQPTEDERIYARCLFAEVLDAPGGLKIMTIHAFCDRVLRRFPLEAGVPPSFTILTDEERRTLLQDASQAILHDAARTPKSKTGKALKTVISTAGEDRFQELLQSVIGKQQELRDLIREQMEDDPFSGLEHCLRAALGVGRDETLETILAEQAETASDALIASAIAILREGKKSDNDLASNLAAAQSKSGAIRIEALAKAFLTEKSQPRSDARFMTKALREAHPGIAEALCRARDDFASLEVKRRALDCAIASAALLRLADTVLQLYEETKAQRGAMDFDGLIAKTAGLFNRSDAAAWVLFRLDADLRHILVDEAQDTSPGQWALVCELTAEFFAGEGVEERTNTLFAVGDEKQSIYGFQGADPRQFAETGRDYSARARAAQRPWIEAPITLSYRSTRAVLEAVDLVFSDQDKTSGLTADGQPVTHFAHRAGEAGLVEIWPPVKAEPQEAAPAWEPFSESASAPVSANLLATQIARQIRHWLDKGERLQSLNRPISPGDILILVRKRDPFAAPMVRALKRLGIPVAGADRMTLTSQLAVQDLMALGDALLLPEDDLTLATVLKSPVFGFDDDDLFAIGYGRTGSLWAALTDKAAENPAYEEAIGRLETWRAAATEEKPFDFYIARLEKDGLRQRILARLGPDAADAIDEFLNLALSYEENETPSLQGFLNWLRVSEPQIKRDMDAGREEVRVMTAHGSKGLEANIVFLADTCSHRSAAHGGLTELAHSGAAPLPVWTLPGSRLVPAIDEACEADQQREREEYQRLLYVAMTRARDRLYVAGFEGKAGRSKGCWYDLICEGLDGRIAEATDYAGNSVMRMECAQEVPPKETPESHALKATPPLPGWHGQKPPAAALPVLINPSRLDLSTDPGASGTASTRPRREALLRGRLVHRLLEQLPPLGPEQWEKSGATFLAAEGTAFSAKEREQLLAETIQILKHSEFGSLFGPDSLAEVPFTAELPANRDGRPPIRISGQIDRLICRQEEVMILDFKTGAAVPDTPDDVPGAYLAQLAAYRLAVSDLFSVDRVQAALLWTQKPLLMPIPFASIETGERLLYESVRAQHLDNSVPSTQL